MKGYMEQTVSRPPSWYRRVLRVLCVLCAALLLFAALIFAMGRPGSNTRADENSFAAVLLTVIAFAFYYFRPGDEREYDYLICAGKLEVVAVLRGKKRVKKLDLEISRIIRCGIWPIAYRAETKLQKLHLPSPQRRTALVYEEEGREHVVLLELNDEMIACLRKELSFGVWRDAEGKSI